MGRYEEAKKWADRLYTMYSKTETGWNRRGQPYYLGGDHIKSIEYIETALAKYPDSWFIKSEGSRWLFAAGHYERVIELLDTENLRFPRNLGYIAMANYKMGNTDTVENIQNELKLKSESSSLGSPAFYIAMIYAQIGEKDKAYEWLNRSLQENEVELYWLMVEPPFEPIRSDPRWEDMLYKVGFDVNLKG